MVRPTAEQTLDALITDPDAVRQHLDLERYLEKEREKWPGLNEDALFSMAHGKRRLEWFGIQRERLLNMATDRTEAARLFEVLGSQYRNLEQRLHVIRQVLIAKELVPKDEAMKVETRFEDAALQERRLAALQEEQALKDAREQIIAACKDRGEALRIWNVEIAKPFGLRWDTLDKYCRALVTAEQLGKEWLPGRKLGAKLHELRKMLSPATENKMLAMEDLENK